MKCNGERICKTVMPLCITECVSVAAAGFVRGSVRLGNKNGLHIFGKISEVFGITNAMNTDDHKVNECVEQTD